MILQFILDCVWKLVNFLVSTLGSLIHITSPNLDITPLLNVMSYGVYFFGPATFCLVVNTIVGWLSIHMIWAIIEWIYKKIPGIS